MLQIKEAVAVIFHPMEGSWDWIPLIETKLHLQELLGNRTQVLPYFFFGQGFP